MELPETYFYFCFKSRNMEIIVNGAINPKVKGMIGTLNKFTFF